MATIGTFGGRGMGQTCGVADPSQWMRMFGVDIDSRDTTQLIRRAEKLPAAELEALGPRLAKLFGKKPPQNIVNERSIRLYLALKAIVEEEGFDFYTIQSFPGPGDDYSATCFAQSMMLEDGVPTSTLGDFNTALSVFLLMKLSRDPVYYGDLQHIDKSTREIKIIGDGAVPPSLAGKLGPAGFAWLVAGGLFYTVGIVFFVLDTRLKHAHGIWHLFVLAGSASHYVAILFYVL